MPSVPGARESQTDDKEINTKLRTLLKACQNSQQANESSLDCFSNFYETCWAKRGQRGFAWILDLLEEDTKLMLQHLAVSKVKQRNAKSSGKLKTLCSRPDQRNKKSSDST